MFRARQTAAAVILAVLIGSGAVFPPAQAAALPADAVVVTAAFTFAPGDDSFNDPLKTDTLVITRGQGVGFANLDTAPHNMTADATPSGSVAFASKTVTITDTLQRNAPVDVIGVRSLTPGRYGFHCAVHPTMHGVLVVQ